MKNILDLIQKAAILLKGGSGSGNFGHDGRPGEVGGSGGGGSLTGDDYESGALRTRISGEWSSKHGVTSAKVLAGIARGLKRGLPLNEAVDHAYRMANRGLTVPVYIQPKE